MKTYLIFSIILSCILSAPVYSGQWSEFGKSISCLSPDFKINTGELSVALELPRDTQIEILKPNRCIQKFEKDNDIPAQIYGIKKELSVRVEIEGFLNMITVVALNNVAKKHIKFIHLLYVIKSKPYHLISFNSSNGSGHRATAWHIWGDQKQYRCPKTVDYLAVLEWKSGIKIPHKALKFRARAMPAACEEM